MSIKDVCQVCESHPADHQCDRCGTVICRIHFDAEMRLCAECADRAKPDDRRGDTFRF